MHKMSDLKIGQEDLRKTVDVQMQVQERLIQIVGHFFKYDAVLDKSILIKEGLFLCVDKILAGEKGEEDSKYMIHVLDSTGQLSYCRSIIQSERAIQLSVEERVLYWIGDSKPDGSISAWVFYVVNEHDLKPLKGIITKTIIETNAQELQKKTGAKKTANDSANNEDSEWLEAQLIGDKMQVDFDATSSGDHQNDSEFLFQNDSDDEQRYEEDRMDIESIMTR